MHLGFLLFPSFHLSFKAFSLFILFHLKHLKIYLSLSCEMKKAPLSVFQSVEKTVCGKGGRISLYSAPEYNQVLFPVCFLFYVFDYVISLEGEMFSHFCLSAVVILNFLSVFFTESSII